MDATKTSGTKGTDRCFPKGKSGYCYQRGRKGLALGKQKQEMFVTGATKYLHEDVYYIVIYGSQMGNNLSISEEEFNK